MVSPVFFTKCYSFCLFIDGKEYGCSEITGIEQLFCRNGHVKKKAVEISHSPREGVKSFAQLFGNRPRHKRNISVVEYRGGSRVPTRTIRMKKCRVTSVKIGSHDASSNDVLIDRVKFVPGKVNVVFHKEGHGDE